MKDQLPLMQRLDRCIDRIATYNDALHAMITPLPEDARREAAEHHARAGQGALTGVIMSVKDNIDTAGIRTTRGSNGLPIASQITMRLSYRGCGVRAPS
jgi:aspartyl-tRNA(Asn)/glutamyl-tRNA(Gln) amidotransferase subunit A